MNQQHRTTPQNVILIGFMGTGKTSVGKLIARSLGFQFVDTDAMIVEREMRPIPDIFADRGEPAFRLIESAALGSLEGRKRIVVSTGGGIVTFPENLEVMRSLGMVVWLDAGPEAIFERVSANDERPLLQTDDPLRTIREMLAERAPLYEAAADLRVDTENLDPGELSYGLAESVRVWFGGN